MKTKIAVFFSFFFTQLVFAKMEIALVDEVEVTKKESYSLFDIVYLKKGTALELESLKKIKILDLTKSEIINVVRDNKDKIQLKVNDDFKIKTTKNLSREEGIRKVKNYLLTQCDECIFDIQVTQLTENSMLDFSLSESAFQGSRGSFMIPLKSTTSKLTGWFVGTWKTFKKVPVLNKWVAQKSRVMAEDLKEELKEVTFFMDKILSKEELLGKQVNRALSAGSIITREMIVHEAAVRKGDAVKLILKNGEIEIEVQGFAESDGQYGEKIKIKTGLNKIITGIVSEKGQVVSE
ncbi:MAG: flagellar basal body P-ring formation protein FlgA [Bdellovibrionaceae bacterium]|nr:flagellar basal body P-ring formation protein FlgA [Pseudobdellovibrionaceae bacterium]